MTIVLRLLILLREMFLRSEVKDINSNYIGV